MGVGAGELIAVAATFSQPDQVADNKQQEDQNPSRGECRQAKERLEATEQGRRCDRHHQAFFRQEIGLSEINMRISQSLRSNADRTDS